MIKKDKGKINKLDHATSLRFCAPLASHTS